MGHRTEVVFSGTKLRDFLLRSGMTYKEAAERTGVDKNTIGKAVRGGSVNVALLLKICNSCRIPIEWFFKTEDVPEDYPRAEPELPEEANETKTGYGETNGGDHVSWEIVRTKEEEISLLNRLIDNYKSQIDLLQRTVDELVDSRK